MKKALLGTLLIVALCFLAVLPALAETETIPNWAADSPAMQSIVAFVTASVDETSDGYIPKTDRIAVFDNDGTLYGERFPTYFNDWLYIQRALYDDTYEAAEKQPDDLQTEDVKFTYVHDPREIPDAMKDIIENPDAVYGFSPNPQSTRLGQFAEIDWTDPEVVAQKTEERRAYHESMESMMDILRRMIAEGASMEEMARAISAERNRLRLASYQNDPETLAFAKQSNLQTYGNEEGPTPEWLYEKHGSWISVVQSAFSTNMGMDACCGLFDEYYWLYIELGLVEDNAAVSQ